MSCTSSGVLGNRSSSYPSSNWPGDLIAFHSEATNLVTGDTNGFGDVFLKNKNNQAIEIISVTAGGAPANGLSAGVNMDPSGNLVVFYSNASNLSSGDTNGTYDIFLRDRAAGTMTRISVSRSGGATNGPSTLPSISTDGRFVVYESDGSNMPVEQDLNAVRDIFVFDRSTQVTKLVTMGIGGVQTNGASLNASVSADGRFVAFESLASNLVSGDSGFRDIFVADRLLGVTERISVGSSGQSNADSSLAKISGDGRYVVFQSGASNLVANDTNGKVDIFIRDRLLGTIERVSMGAAGAQANNNSFSAAVSFDGTWVAFHSDATNLIAGDSNNATDVFVRNRVSGATTRESVASSGTQGNSTSTNPAFSGDKSILAFASWASNLVTGDTNNYGDIFVHTLLDPVPTLIGTVELGDYTGPADDEWLEMKLLDDLGNVLETLPLVRSDASGNYRVTCQTATSANLVVKGRTWLAQSKTVTPELGSAVNVDFTLTNGDVNNDNEIGPADFTRLSAAFGSMPGDGNWDHDADLTGDDEVGPADFTVLSTNFGLMGD